MSEKRNDSEMSASSGNAPDFCSCLATLLEDYASHGDHESCLSIIQFIRRFTADVPVTDYRTVGYPTAIKRVLDALDMTESRDYDIEVSNLDSSSHVLSFRSSDKTIKALGILKGFRVSKGPSISDLLYCEAIKDKDRDFVSVFAKARACDEQESIASYILKRTCDIYNCLAKVSKEIENGTRPNSNLTEHEKAVCQFARTQIADDGKLLPSANPVVIPAVAELYNSFVHGWSSDLFRLGKNPDKWISARPLAADERIPVKAAEVPVQLLRNQYNAFDNYMPTDAYAFNERANGINESDGPVFVACSSILNFSAKDDKAMVQEFSVMTDYSNLFTYLQKCYHACYPELGMSIHERSSVKLAATSRFVMGEFPGKDNIRTEMDEILGITDETKNNALIMVSEFMFSTNKPRLHIEQQFPSVQPIRVTTCIKDSAEANKNGAKHSKPTKGTSVADEWFELVHAVKSPKYSEKEATEKMLGYLTESCGVQNSLTVAVAIGVRSAISCTMDKYGTGYLESLNQLKTIDKENLSPLHSKDCYVTQLISSVLGQEERSIASFVKDNTSGKATVAPGIRHGYAELFIDEAPGAVSEFIEIADTTNMQLRMPRKISGMMIFAETNINVDTLREIESGTSGLRDLLRKRIAHEISRIWFGSTYAHDDSKGVVEWPNKKRILSSFGSVSRMAETLKAIENGFVRDFFDVHIIEDKYGRMLLAIRVDATLGFLALLTNAKEDDVVDIIDMAMRNDPSYVVLSKENWKEELMDVLVSEVRNRGIAKLASVCDSMIGANNEQKSIGDSVPVSCRFSGTPASDMFCCDAEEYDYTDPN